MAALLLAVCGPPARAAADPQPAPPWPPAMAAELPDVDKARASVLAAWKVPSEGLDQRGARAQRAGLALGIRELDGPARALLLNEDLGEPRLRAEVAARLAPGLPAAHAALAEARLASGDPRGALRALRAAIDAAPEHLEARAWLGAVGFRALTLAAFLLALLYLALGAIAAVPALVHGLGASRLALQGPSAFAALGCVALLPALLEGPAGAALGLAALAIASGPLSKRIAVAAVAAVALAGLYAGIDRLAVSQLALSADPLAVAAHRVETGLPTPSEVAAVLRAASDDPIAARAAAVQSKRSGELAAARQYFARLGSSGADPVALNNAANVAFELGDNAAAIELYERAERAGPSSVVLFNLAQAYGRAVRLDEQDRALLRAQALDPRTLERISGAHAAEASVYVTDLAIASGQVIARAEASGEPEVLASALRRQIAPGWLGRGAAGAALPVALVLGVAIVAGRALTRGASTRDFYADIARTLQTGVGDSSQRVAQLTRLRRRRARTERLLTLLALVVPGAAGLRWGRPIPALLASIAACFAAAIVIAQLDAPPDPIAVGALSGQLTRIALAAAACLYLLSTGLAFVLRAED